jgi:hypothetical protein
VRSSNFGRYLYRVVGEGNLGMWTAEGNEEVAAYVRNAILALENGNQPESVAAGLLVLLAKRAWNPQHDGEALDDDVRTSVAVALDLSKPGMAEVFFRVWLHGEDWEAIRDLDPAALEDVAARTVKQPTLMVGEVGETDED